MGILDPSLRPLLLREYKNDAQSLAYDEATTPTPTFDWLARRTSSGFPPSPTIRWKKDLVLHWTISLWFTAYFGIYFNLVLLFRNVLGEGSGAVASDTNTWLGSMFLASLLGAFIAQSLLGCLWACPLFPSIAVIHVQVGS